MTNTETRFGAAIFDLDHTIIPGSSERALLAALREQSMVSCWRQWQALTTLLRLSVRFPSPGFDSDSLHNYLYKRGFTIYPGKIPGTDCFRLANMGAINVDDIRAFLSVLTEALPTIDGLSAH